MTGKLNLKFILLIFASYCYDYVTCACSCTCDGQPVKTTMSTASRPPQQPELPKASCALAHDTNYTVGDPQKGYRFGTRQDSRIEYGNLPARQSGGYNLTIHFRTFDKYGGLIFYSKADNATDKFLAVYMTDALLHVATNCGEHIARVSSNQTYYDTNWHQVQLIAIEGTIKVTVDNKKVGENNCSHHCRNLTCYGPQWKILTQPFYFGGLKEVPAHYYKRVGFYQPFKGCLQGLQSNGEYVTDELQRVNALPCIDNDNVEDGLYFEPAEGSYSSYLELVNHFRVSDEMIITMDVKPRSNTGLLLYLNAWIYYLSLEMLENEVVVKVENGRGVFRASYILGNKSLCDGRWHTIHVVKSHFIVSVGVDAHFSNPGLVNSTDTSFGLYIGGHERDTQTVWGTQSRQGFVGCIRNIKINDNYFTVQSNAKSRGVHKGGCPLN